MKLDGIDFGPVLSASAMMGMFGEGYWYHKLYKALGLLSFDGVTFVSKTKTLEPREGNLETKEGGYQAKKWFPDCIKINFKKGTVLNSVGLANPGAKELFNHGKWQKRTEPFMLSFMSDKAKREERLNELKQFVKIFQNHKDDFQAPVGLQMNFSCPNTETVYEYVINEIHQALDIASELNIPLVPKYNVLLSPEAVVEIDQHPACSGHCCTNTIPWGELNHKINWKEYFESDESPLEHLGGGGLSGAPLLELVSEWVEKCRKLGVKKPINAGGGIMKPKDVEVLKEAGADSIFFCTVSMVRPWRVQPIVDKAHEVFNTN